MTNADKRIKLLKKLQALAERGVGGEKETAERKLNQLIEKYGIDEAELSDDKVVFFDFEYRNKWEQQLLRQLLYRMFGPEFCSKIYTYKYGKGSKSIYRIECTQEEGLQLRVEYNFYRTLF